MQFIKLKKKRDHKFVEQVTAKSIQTKSGEWLISEKQSYWNPINWKQQIELKNKRNREEAITEQRREWETKREVW